MTNPSKEYRNRAILSNSAQDYVKKISSPDCKIILVDGDRLAELMIEHDTGVYKVVSYDVKRIDHDFFQED